MGIIEQRINEILQANTYILQQKQFDTNDNNVRFEQVNFSGFLSGSQIGPGKISMTNLGSIIPQPHITSFAMKSSEMGQSQINNTATAGKKSFSAAAGIDNDDEEDEEDDDDDMKPMGIEEFKARVMGMK